MPSASSEGYRSASRVSTSPTSAPAAAVSPGETTAGCCVSVPGAPAPTLVRPATVTAEPNPRSPTPSSISAGFGRTASSAAGCPSCRIARKRSCVRSPIPWDSRSTTAARAIVDVGVAHINGAVRLVSTQRGHDPRAYALYAYGGMGPLVGALVAEEIGITRVVVPPHPGLFSALGLLVADLERTYRQTSIARLTGESIPDVLADLRPTAGGRGDRIRRVWLRPGAGRNRRPSGDALPWSGIRAARPGRSRSRREGGCAVPRACIPRRSTRRGTAPDTPVERSRSSPTAWSARVPADRSHPRSPLPES